MVDTSKTTRWPTIEKLINSVEFSSQRRSSSCPALSSVHQVEKLIPRFGTRSHAAKHTARNCAGGRFLHSPHYHAQMTRFHDHSNALRIQDLCYCHCNLLCQALLYLESPREHFSQPCQFRETKYSSYIPSVRAFGVSGYRNHTIRYVSYMHLRIISDKSPLRSTKPWVKHTFPVNGTI